MTKCKSQLGLILGTLVLGATLIAPGCGFREHTRSDYGQNNRAFYAAQQKKDSEAKAEGLDSEEAALVHKNYRKTLGGKDAEAPPESQVLILNGDAVPTARRTRGRK